MKKRCGAILILSLFCFSMTACAQKQVSRISIDVDSVQDSEQVSETASEEAFDMTRPTDIDFSENITLGEISLMVPSGWKIEDLLAGEGYEAYPSKKINTPRITVETYPNVFQSQTAMDEIERRYEGDILRKQKNYTVDGCDSELIQIEHTSGPEKGEAFNIFVFLTPDNVYMLRLVEDDFVATEDGYLFIGFVGTTVEITPESPVSASGEGAYRCKVSVSLPEGAVGVQYLLVGSDDGAAILSEEKRDGFDTDENGKSCFTVSADNIQGNTSGDLFLTWIKEDGTTQNNDTYPVRVQFEEQ